jgi:triosephosphate isomerase (TIM)
MMSSRRPVIAANWKMHKTIAETTAFLDDFLPRLDADPGADVVICPPYLALAAAVDACAGGGVTVAGQNMHDQPQGAFTGEVSAPMLVELGVGGVILGHSERRAYFAETDEALARKLPAALDAGLLPILCVGETEAQRDAEETEEVLRFQLEADLAGVADEALAAVVIAYEPVWAIGTGRTATADQAAEAIGWARSVVAARNEAAAEAIRILYGGSVKPDNAADLLAHVQIDGALVGGASLDPEAFAAIVAAARA